jgi:predicted N-acetyltransferase YhbS
MHIRTATFDDRSAIRDLVLAASGDPGDVELVEKIWAASEYLPRLDIVAELDGAVVGHVLHSIGYVGDREVAALAPLMVAPNHQRQGLGTSLMHEAIARANAARHPAIVLTGHASYYPRFGFVPARSVGIEPGIDLPTDPDPFMVRLLDAWDASITGVFRYCWE